MTQLNAPIERASTRAGTWSVCLAASAFLLIVVLQTAWGLLILLPRWRLVAGEADPAYVAQYNLGTALFSGIGVLLALGAVVLGAQSIGGAKPFPRGHPGRKTAIVRGWIGIVLGSLLAVYGAMMVSYIF